MNLKLANGYVGALDGVRGIAILMVMFFHCSNSSIFPFDWIKSLGWLGVDVFFVLSGFLITGILLDTREKQRYLRNFFIRRALRIFPVYYFFLALFVAYVFLANQPQLAFYTDNLLFFFTYTQNLLFSFKGWPAGSQMLNHLWSLAIEEQFYLLWPFVVHFVPRNRLLLVGFFAVVTTNILRYLTIDDPAFFYTFSLCRWDGLILGSMSAVLLRQHLTLLNKFILPMTLMSFAATIFVVTTSNSVLAITAFCFFFASLVLLCFDQGIVGRALSGLFSFEIFKTIGKYSYGMYLFHLPIYTLYVVYLSHPPFIATLITTLTVSVASYHLLEIRFLKLKERFA